MPASDQTHDNRPIRVPLMGHSHQNPRPTASSAPCSIAAMGTGIFGRNAGLGNSPARKLAGRVGSHLARGRPRPTREPYLRLIEPFIPASRCVAIQQAYSKGPLPVGVNSTIWVPDEKSGVPTTASVLLRASMSLVGPT